MTRLLSIISILIVLGTPLYAQHNEDEYVSIESELERLDQMVETRYKYQHRCELQADSLKKIYRTTTGLERVNTLRQIFQLYIKFDADSAWRAIREMRSLPEHDTCHWYQQMAQLGVIHINGSRGLYMSALEDLDKIRQEGIDPKCAHVYYNVRHIVMGLLTDYAIQVAPYAAERYRKQRAAVLDTLIELEDDPIERRILIATQLHSIERYQECCDTLRPIIPLCNDEQLAKAYYRMARGYNKLKINDAEIRYLARAAYYDLRLGKRDYQALRQMSLRLSRMGQHDRAYNYMVCAIEDAHHSKTSVRTLQASNLFPILNNEKEKQQAQRRFLYSINIIVLVFLLIGAVVWAVTIHHKNHKLKEARREIDRIDALKQDYLISLLSKSRSYLSTFVSFQRQMYKLYQAQSTTELGKQLKSNTLAQEELDRFYKDFDESFLRIYPDFIDRFNALLKPESRITPKNGELLTAELRIFALIFLGETETQQIAKLLSYSVTTIYNYRSRVRGQALGAKEDFEAQVAHLYD